MILHIEITEFPTSIKLMLIDFQFHFMPVDRELAVESLKRLDEKLYNMYQKLKDAEEYIKNDTTTFQKLQLYLLSLDALDDLESLGIIEIINDYRNKAVFVRRNYQDKVV